MGRLILVIGIHTKQIKFQKIIEKFLKKIRKTFFAIAFGGFFLFLVIRK